VTRIRIPLLLLLGWLLALPAQALELPRTAPVPGGIVVLDLGPANRPRPEVRYRQRRVMVVRHHGRWKAVLGIPLSARPGRAALEVRQGKHRRRLSFRVRPKTYPVQRLHIRDRHKVNPDAAELARIRRESRRIHADLRHWRARPPRRLRLHWPVHGIVSSTFGLRRILNGQPRHPHSGLDIAVPAGTPIRAPAPGRVVDTGHFFFDGKTVFLDHGEGMVTMYGHMSRIDVKPGQWVRTGQVLGAVGQTGRATGPHLHWGVSLNDARVDPRLLLATPASHP